jgi:hypothetical protein
VLAAAGGFAAWRAGVLPSALVASGVHTRSDLTVPANAPALAPAAPAAESTLTAAVAPNETPTALLERPRHPSASASRTGRGARGARVAPLESARAAAANAPEPAASAAQAERPEPAASAASSESPAPAPANRLDRECVARCQSNVDCMMRCPVRRSSEPDDPPAAAPTEPSQPTTPSREDVLRALGAVGSVVHGCASGRIGNASVTLTFANSGRVTTASISPPFAGSPEGSCMALAMRTIRVAPFTTPTFQITVPFRVQ